MLAVRFGATPVTIPVLLTVAIVGEPLNHVPPGVTLLNVIGCVTHTRPGPIIGVKAPTVIVVVAKHPVGNR